MTRALIDEHRGTRSYADLSRAIGQRPEWLSRVLTHSSPRRGRLPEIGLVNALAAELRIAPGTLLVALGVDSGLCDEELTLQHLQMGAAFRRLSPDQRAQAIRLVRTLSEPES